MCRENDTPDPTPHSDVLKEYVRMAPLIGDVYQIDNFGVRTYVMKYIAGNENSEVTIQSIQDTRNGRKAVNMLSDLYEAVGVNGVDISRADNNIRNLYYTGEKKPHIRWAEFEKQLNWAFGAHDKREKREVYSNEHRLCILLNKVKADFLEQTKSSINVDLSKIPIIYTYLQALSCLRDKVNEKYPPHLTSNNIGYPRATKGISNVQRNGRGYRRLYGRFPGGRGRNGGRFGGRFNGGRHTTRGDRGNWVEKTRSASRIVVLTDGTKIKMYP